MTTLDDNEILNETINQMNIILEVGWLEGNYQPPNILLAFEPMTESWYFVTDDFSPIVDLIDGNGRTYAISKRQCFIKDGVYICNGVDSTGDYPTSDREYFVEESLVPLLNQTIMVV